MATFKILTKAGLCSQKPLVHRVFGGISQMFKCWKSILSNQGRSEAQSTALHPFRPGRCLRFCPCLTSASPGNNHFAICYNVINVKICYNYYSSIIATTLQSMINEKLSQQRFWHCCENSLFRTIQQSNDHNVVYVFHP